VTSPCVAYTFTHHKTQNKHIWSADVRILFFSPSNNNKTCFLSTIKTWTSPGPNQGVSSVVFGLQYQQCIWAPITIQIRHRYIGWEKKYFCSNFARRNRYKSCLLTLGATENNIATRFLTGMCKHFRDRDWKKITKYVQSPVLSVHSIVLIESEPLLPVQ